MSAAREAAYCRLGPDECGSATELPWESKNLRADECGRTFDGKWKGEVHADECDWTRTLN